MHPDLDELVAHDMSDDCPVCRAQEVVALTLLPAAAAWEASYELPRYAIALHGAAELLGVMLAEGAARERIEEALGQLLDDIEQRIAEERTMGGPPQGTA